MKYFYLWWLFFISCFKKEIIFKGDFFLKIISHLFWFLFSIIFFRIIYLYKSEIGGWNLYQTLCLLSVNQIIISLYESFFAPNIRKFQNYIEDGSFDHFIIKPLDLQFFVSTRFINFNPLFSLSFSILLLIYSLKNLNLSINFMNILIFLFLLLIGVVIRYIFGFLIMTLSFYFVRINSLYALHNEFLKYSGYPSSIYPKPAQFFFIFIIPVIVIANFPAMSLMKFCLSYKIILYSIVFVLFMFFLSRKFFYYSIKKYVSASS
ncbi:MAG: ABC transporter permease [Candidatus Omnitrophica bacterium]|nr:ABC transporter permease [Candidatus Omnitrophota bacterium]